MTSRVRPCHGPWWCNTAPGCSTFVASDHSSNEIIGFDEENDAGKPRQAGPPSKTAGLLWFLVVSLCEVDWLNEVFQIRNRWFLKSLLNHGCDQKMRAPAVPVLTNRKLCCASTGFPVMMGHHMSPGPAAGSYAHQHVIYEDLLPTMIIATAQTSSARGATSRVGVDDHRG